VAVPGGTALVTFYREAGKIDLNTATPELIYALFAANGWTDKDARAIADRIADWRDADGEVRPEGAERSQYEAAGLPYGPRNEPFRSLSEVRQVLSGERISPDLLEAFTVYTHLSAPVERLAVKPAGRALSYADVHELGGHRWLSSTELARPDASADIHALAGEVVSLNACAQSGLVTRCRTAVIRLTGNVRKPLQTLVWQSQFKTASPTLSSAAR
jgi:hypothetical protein